MSVTVTKSVAAEVRAEIARQQISQKLIAEALSLSQTSVWRRLRGEVPFNVDELAKVATLLGVPASRFLERAA